ncbi:lysozyme inhibitor LprI family protein [Rossellomorea sp. NS-SX7]|uniref:lysozyme inhibitor LprI family protein n=1 Tax=Rossellomorea sp. NS-SX7 TaxID=3463856 RepID=UPI0040594B0F
MNHHRKTLLGIVVAMFVILAACGQSPEGTSVEGDKQSQADTHNDSTEHASSDGELKQEQGTQDPDKKEETPRTDEESSANESSMMKEEYLEKLHDAQVEVEELREATTDDSTYALKYVEGERFDIWDGLLNDIYGVLKEQLSPEEMEQLRVEQREWIKHRDETAKQASLKYEGGTMEQLEYVAVENNLTEKRCFELVEEYMG